MGLETGSSGGGGGGVRAGCDEGLEPACDGVEGEEDVLRDTNRVIPPRVESSSASLLTLGPKKENLVVSTLPCGLERDKAECARSFSFCKMG